MTEEEAEDYRRQLRAGMEQRKAGLAATTCSADVNVLELSDNAWDIGIVSGVLQGIELTPTLLPNQKEAIADARKAIKRIEERNQRLVVKAANPQNSV